MFRRLLIIFSLVLFLAAGFSARAYYNPGKPAGFVNDYTGTLNSEQVSALENKLNQFNATTTNEISVVIINSLKGDTIENFAVKLFADWGIGKAKQDNGVLLLVAMEDRKMRIETGYGLEGALPDATAYQIITKTLTPAFKNSDYYGGLDRATDDIIAVTKGEYQADNTAAAGDNFGVLKKMDFELVIFLIIILLQILAGLWRWLAKSKSWWQGGALGAAIGLIIVLIFFRTLLLFIILPLAIGFFGLLFDFLVSRILPQPVKTKGGRNNFWFFGGGPGGFGGSGGGGGFGGFGGGMSGGGGSSGSW